MACSEAQRVANRANAARSTGPRTDEGKERSRRNALKHGLTGAGIVLPHEDEAVVTARFADFAADLRPEGGVAHFLTRRLALLSVRLDRAALHESATLTERIEELDRSGGEKAKVLEVDPAAAARAQFDTSPDAILARRYEAATERAFFRTLKEIRQTKTQEIPIERIAAVAPPSPPVELGSFGGVRPSVDRDARMARPVPIPARPALDFGPVASIRSADQVRIGRTPTR